LGNNTIDGGGDDSTRSVMADLAGRYLTHNIEATLATVTAAAVKLMDGVDYADVMLINGEELQSRAPTAPLVVDLDEVQLRMKDGPCLRAAMTDTVITCPDLADDSRWPDFAAAALEVGVQSTLSFPLFRRRNGGAALNLMSCSADAMDRADHTIGAMLATHAAMALTASDRISQFESALASRDLIGQAKGMLMERFDVDADRAFELLTKLSQETNTPVRTIAGKIARP
jgi:ANTAR domain/GAF domain